MNFFKQVTFALFTIFSLFFTEISKAQTSSFTDLPSTTYTSNVRQVVGPEGGSVYGDNGTGAIKIQIPPLTDPSQYGNNIYTNSQFTIKLDVSSRNNSNFTLVLTGKSEGVKWVHTGASVLENNIDENYNVYFGDSGSTYAIWIGESTNFWNQYSFRISEVIVSRGWASDTCWTKGWNVSLDNSDFKSNSTNPIVTVTNAFQPLNSNANNNSPGLWTDEGNDIISFAGSAHAREVRVYTTAGADFVFEEDYDLLELEKLEAFVKKNKHLPEIVPEKIMVEEGIGLGEMNVKLLQKVEELTLYLIDVNKKVKALEKELTEKKTK